MSSSSPMTATATARFNTVKRKLETMKYSEPLDKLSVPLAEHLVDDLVHTTESYRNLKLQHNRTVQEFGSAADKLNALTKEHDRVLLENNMLHLETIKASETKDDAERRLYQRLKSQEEKIAEFQFWKEQNFDKFQKMEKENHILRKQLEEIRPGFVGSTLSKKLRDSTDASPADAPPSSAKVIGDLKTELEAEREAKEELMSQVRVYKSKVDHREAEIKRLAKAMAAPLGGKRKAQSLDKLMAAETEEEREIQLRGLNQQVEYLTEKLAAYDDLHDSYQAIEEEKYQLVKKIDDVLGENKSLQYKLAVAEKRTRAEVDSEEIASLKFTMSKYEEEMLELSSSLKKERHLAKTLQAKLEIVEDTSKRTEGTFKEKVAAHETAKWRITQLEGEKSELEGKAEGLAAQVDLLQGKIADIPVKDATIEHLEKTNRDLTAKLAESQSEVRRHLDSLNATNEVLSKRSEESNAFVSLKIELESKVTELEKRNQLLMEDASKKDVEAKSLQEKWRLRSSDNARMEVVVKNLQSELDSTKSMNAILNDRVSLLKEEKKSQEPLINKLRIEYNDLHESTSAKISAMHTQTMELTKQNMDLAEKLGISEKSVENLTKEMNELSMEFTHKKSEKSDVEKENAELSAQIKSLSLAKDIADQKAVSLSKDGQMKDIELTALQQEVGHFKDQSAQMRKVLQEKSADLAKSEEEKIALQEKLQTAKDLAERQQRDLAEAQTRVVSTFSQEEEKKTQVALEQANAIKFKSLYEKARSEVNILKDQISNVSSMEDSYNQELYFAKTQADERLFEINQLKTLISQLDLTQGKLVGKLKLTIAELEETKREKKEVEDLCTVHGEAKSEISTEVTKLKDIIASLDSDKDKIQNELDAKCESLKRLEDTVENQSMELHSAKLELSNSQIKIQEMEGSFKTFKSEYDSILAQCKKLHAGTVALQTENANAHQEINALSEDMTQMAREQQIVNADLVKATSERNELQDECKVLQRKTLDQERIIQMKLKEIKEYTQAYKELGLDNQQFLAKMADLEREIMEKNALIVAKDSEMESMEAIVSELEVENRRAVSDLTTYEAATSELTSALSSAENKMDRDSRQKVSLLEKAKISKQNALQLEAARNQMQNEIYKVQVAKDNLEKTLGDVSDENAYLREQLSAQANKERNLEGIIGDLRSREYNYKEAETSLPAHEEEIRSLRADNERLLQLLNNHEERKVMDQANEEEMKALKAQNDQLLQLLSHQETKGKAEKSETSEASEATSGSPLGAKTPRTKLNEQLTALRDENKRLRSNLQATQETVGKMGNEIQRVREEYKAVVKDLTDL